MEAVGLAGLWKFRLTPAHCSERWIPFLDRTTPAQTFLCHGQALRPTSLQAPGQEVRLRRIVVYCNGGHEALFNGGPWIEENFLLTQYTWLNGPQLTTYSTSALRMLQNQQVANDHPAIRKWEAQLHTRLPEHIWHNTCLPFRSAKENFFLWQIIFRAIATLSWVFPNRPHSDCVTWCHRCPLQVREDILHCLWQCPSSQECWNWIGELITRAAGYILAASFHHGCPHPPGCYIPSRIRSRFHLLFGKFCGLPCVGSCGRQGMSACSHNSLRIPKLLFGRRGIVLVLSSG